MSDTCVTTVLFDMDPSNLEQKSTKISPKKISL
jgi:hypothetical protein